MTPSMCCSVASATCPCSATACACRLRRLPSATRSSPTCSTSGSAKPPPARAWPCSSAANVTGSRCGGTRWPMPANKFERDIVADLDVFRKAIADGVQGEVHHNGDGSSEFLAFGWDQFPEEFVIESSWRQGGLFGEAG